MFYCTVPLLNSAANVPLRCFASPPCCAVPVRRSAAPFRCASPLCCSAALICCAVPLRHSATSLGCADPLYRSAALIRCGISLHRYAAPYVCSVPPRCCTVQFRCNVLLQCSAAQFGCSVPVGPQRRTTEPDRLCRSLAAIQFCRAVPLSRSAVLFRCGLPVRRSNELLHQAVLRAILMLRCSAVRFHCVFALYCFTRPLCNFSGTTCCISCL